MKSFLNVLVLILMLEYSFSDTSKDSSVQFLFIANFDNCEGNDVGNLTVIASFKRDSTCSIESTGPTGNDPVIISRDSNGQKAVNIEKVLSLKFKPAGAYEQVDVFSVISSGPLQGKYVYEKYIELSVRYLKKCSSVLGYSFVPTKSAILLIMDQLDVNAPIAPNGAFQQFQKSATTTCTGSGFIV